MEDVTGGTDVAAYTVLIVRPSHSVEVVNVLKPVNVWQTDIAKVGSTVKKNRVKNRKTKNTKSHIHQNVQMQMFIILLSHKLCKNSTKYVLVAYDRKVMMSQINLLDVFNKIKQTNRNPLHTHNVNRLLFFLVSLLPSFPSQTNSLKIHAVKRLTKLLTMTKHWQKWTNRKRNDIFVCLISNVKKITGPKWASVTPESRFFVVFFLLVEIVKFFV